ncbi:Uncharacterised protein [Helicobacter pullorum]|nr:Uncharacterised protein [Helicobacter pullorum]
MRITNTEIVDIGGISNEYFSDYFKKKNATITLLKFNVIKITLSYILTDSYSKVV